MQKIGGSSHIILRYSCAKTRFGLFCALMRLYMVKFLKQFAVSIAHGYVFRAFIVEKTKTFYCKIRRVAAVFHFHHFVDHLGINKYIKLSPEMNEILNFEENVTGAAGAHF